MLSYFVILEQYNKVLIFNTVYFQKQWRQNECLYITEIFIFHQKLWHNININT